jgi:hypothetical protein
VTIEPVTGTVVEALDVDETGAVGCDEVPVFVELTVAPPAETLPAPVPLEPVTGTVGEGLGVGETGAVGCDEVPVFVELTATPLLAGAGFAAVATAVVAPAPVGVLA